MIAPTPDGQPIFSTDVWEVLKPRPEYRSWDWICSEGRTPEGEPFDPGMMPWAEGVCDAFDDPDNREIVLPWGTRLGKTMICLQLDCCVMVMNPGPGLFATSREKLAVRVVSEKFYKMFAAIPILNRQMRPDNRRSVHKIVLDDSTWAVAWSGSQSMLADWSAKYGHASEVDKWDRSQTKGGESFEGDTLAQWDERFKDQTEHKKLIESSPTLKGKSRIEARYETSNQCLYEPPCPHCGHHQPLTMGGRSVPHGLKWDSLKDGTMDAELARETARYVCRQCQKDIHDEHRFRMMSDGIWVPKGCAAKDGKVTGKPHRSIRVWGGRLSSLYSLQLRWGDIAGKFCEVRNKPPLLQMFVNGWLAEVWERFTKKSDPQEVGDRLETSAQRGVIPSAATWLFGAVDVQADHFVWTAVAVAQGERIYLVDWGFLDTWGEVQAHLIDKEFPFEGDHVEPMMPCVVGVDSGDGLRTKEVYSFCREHSRTGRQVLPCKGANTNCGGKPWVDTLVAGEGVRQGAVKLAALRGTRGLTLVRVNPFYWEPVIEKALSLHPGDEGSLSIPAGAHDDEELLWQLCNGVQTNTPSKMDPDKLIWEKRWDDRANDYRDTLKYALCLMDRKFRGDWSRARQRQNAKPPPVAPEVMRRRAAEQEQRERGGRQRYRIPRRAKR
ncbi:MAG: phage terminase large subunit family protein [Planctomycetota bacterium]|nr:phage terminase large subunit family protein [Planctomycetota bacterium]